MRRALRRNRRYLIAPLVMVVLATVVVGYILVHQPAFRAPAFLDHARSSPFVFRAEFTSAPAIVAGQGQTVDIAGVAVGDVRRVSLQNGHAVLELEIERRYAPIYRDATILLRPRTPLKDMYLALEPGTPAAGVLPAGGRLPAAQTAPDVNEDEVLANLDGDTRQYLRILLAGAGQALRDGPAADGRPSPTAVADLRAAFERVQPLSRDARRVLVQLARRRAGLRRAVHAFERIATSVAAVDGDLGSLVDAAQQSFGAAAAQDRSLRATLAALPATLSATTRAMGGVSALGARLGPTLAALRPTARALGPALRAARPFARDTTPVLRDRLRPFSRDVQPVVAALQPAARTLAGTLPPLGSTLRVVDRLFNAAAYNPPGSEEGFLFWGTWLAHIGPSLLTAQDAHGATPRSVLLATCSQLDALHQVELGSPSLRPILKLLNPADRLKVCPQSATPVFGR